MEFRLLGVSGFRIPVLSLGTATFGGGGDFFRKWGSSDVDEARRMVDLCLEAGATLFDTADVYSRGLSEEILGEAINGRRDQLLFSTKATFRMSDEPNDVGSSRRHLIESCEKSLRRLKTDYVDIYTMHGFDAQTPIEETLRALDDLVQSGKVRYLACSNFSGWHLMKSLAISDRYGWSRYVAHQAYYSLMGREYEWELMPLALDQGVGTIVWTSIRQARASQRQVPARPAGAREHAPRSGRHGRTRAAAGMVLQPDRRDERHRPGDRQNGFAGGDQLVVAAPHGRQRDHRRTQ